MFEVEVARLQHSHYLQPLYRFAVEGHGGGLHQLGDEAAQSDDVGLQVTVLRKVVQAVE